MSWKRPGALQRRLRDLPSRVGVSFLLAICLVPEDGYRLVRNKMTTALTGLASTDSRSETHRRRDVPGATIAVGRLPIISCDEHPVGDAADALHTHRHHVAVSDQ
ncbi:transposase domain-containing protein [Streptosporangium canum]|uniref:transposase domain-containing protein n=1 Tax=Streptosporangium canum TaxID=324952 RepID=UPI0037A1F5C1